MAGAARGQEGLPGAAVPAPDCSAGNCAGVVVALPEPLAGQLRSLRASFGDPLAEMIPAHITLVTTTPVADWERTKDHVRAVARTQQPFSVTLRGSDSFRPVSPVVYLSIDQGFGPCADLHRRLQQGPLARDLPFPFHPHVTIVHAIDDADMDRAQAELGDFQASFEVTGMGLYLHDGSGTWKLQEELTFGGEAY